MNTTRLALWLLTAAAPLGAQWLNYPTPGIPRLPDGTPNLSAPVPRTADGKPDLSGLWEPTGSSSSTFVGNSQRDPKFQDVSLEMKGGLPLQPWAAELVKARRAENNKDDPDTHCQPLGPIKMHLHPYPRKIIQTPGLLVILFERDTAYRQIFTDGRPLPEDPQPSFNGYSSGKWEGDQLVVKTNGIRDGTWLDVSGTPLTSAALVTERFRRPSFGRLEIDITVDDSKAYTKPWSIHVNQSLASDTELLEFVCLENERDIRHLVGK
ncbi:MAG TPA: hypothetical protein VLY24_13725 [Bryobacteraceae bacterium]|nr:hypothetical protein [Bryobacteraceae bacterium]